MIIRLLSKHEDFFPTYTRYPLNLQTASYTNIRQIYWLEQKIIDKFAPLLTAKACWPSKLERQNVKLALRIFDDSTSAALKICNEPRLERFKDNTAEFIDIIVMVSGANRGVGWGRSPPRKKWKGGNINGAGVTVPCGYYIKCSI